MCQRVVCRGHGGDGIACRFLSFLVSGGRGDGVSSSRPVACVSFLVPFLVLCSCPVCVFFDWRSRVGVPLFVSCLRHVSSGFSCRCCPVAPFLSARVSVLSRLVSSLLSFYSCSSRRACRIAACRVAGRWGVAVAVR